MVGVMVGATGVIGEEILDVGALRLKRIRDTHQATNPYIYLLIH